MRTRFYYILSIFTLLTCSLYAQQSKDACKYHYFKNGGISTSECYENNSSFGKSRALNRKGEIIYEKAIRKVGGHSYVMYDYFDNGAVKRAEWHDAPDGGIQWYQSVTTFSEDGKILNVSEQSHEDMRSPVVKTKPGTPQTRPAPAKKPTETMECAVIYSSEFWFINTTNTQVAILAESKNKGGNSFTIKLKPGTTAKGGSRILAQQFENPYNYYNIKITPAKHKSRDMNISFLKDIPDPDSKEKRRYYFAIQ